MLTIDTSSTLASTIGNHGIADRDLLDLHTPIKRYITDFYKEREQGEHSWAQNPYDEVMREGINIVIDQLPKGIDTVVWVGIGGSSLGPQVIAEAFADKAKRKFILLDSIDPQQLESLLQGVNWKKTLLVVVSKSGGTLEPMSIFTYCYHQMKAALKTQTSQHIIALTDPEAGTLRKFARQQSIRVLPIPSSVGGRYSVFTPVGQLALALLTGENEEFCKGARDMDDVCRNVELDANPAADMAVVQYLLDTKFDVPVRVTMPYIYRLKSLARWNQQLIAESLGKTEHRNPIPTASIGTQDQHSMLQQWMDGPRKQWHVFIKSSEQHELKVPTSIVPELDYLEGKSFSALLKACYVGTSQALIQDHHASATITMPTLDAYHLGQLFYLAMVEVVLLGKLYRIDPYGQPGVELGKKITKELLRN